jgi:GNAT superfamily N-acetyltransferase
MTDPGVILRPAAAADVPRLREIVLAAYGPYVERIGGEPRPMTDDYTDVVARQRVTVAVGDDGVVGLVVLAEEDGDLWIDNVAVDPAVRGTGVGRALLEYAEQVAREEGRGRLWLLTHELMTENRALYERIGYVQQREQPLPDGRFLIHYALSL